MIQGSRIWVLTMVLALSGFMAFGFSASVSAETLRVALNSSWSPYSVGDGNEVDGLLVSLTREIIEKRMGHSVVGVGLPWSRAQRDVENGRLDALVTYASPSRLAYTNASREVMYTLETRAFVRVGSEAEIAIKMNPEIKTHRHFTHCMILGDGWSKAFLEQNNINYETGLDTASCLKQIQAGRQDVFLHVSDTAQTAIQDIDASNDIVMLPNVYSSVPLSLLIAKTATVSKGFLTEFDRILAAMKQDGSYHALVAKLRGMPAPVQLATLEWPPYTGETLSKGGAVSEIIRRAFAATNHDILPYFLPWNRAISYAKSDHNAIIGYYPGYHCNHDDGFFASRPIGESALGFAERTDNDITWTTLDDIEKYRIGTVVGYANSDEFDQRAREGRLKVYTAHDDKSNLQNLAAGNIDVAVIDSQVLSHLMKTHPTLGQQGPTLKLDDKLLKTQTLHLCLKDNEEGRAIAKLFNAGIETLDNKAIWNDFFLAGSQ